MGSSLSVSAEKEGPSPSIKHQPNERIGEREDAALRLYEAKAQAIYSQIILLLTVDIPMPSMQNTFDRR